MAKEVWRYALVLDAGSSGTRCYTYKWRPSAGSLPEITAEHTKKVHTGLSTYGETPQLVAEDHLKPLIDNALKHVPAKSVPETPVFLLATAGMRLLPQHQQKNVLDAVCSYLQEQTGFLIPDCNLHIQVIPGSTEGLYGWIAANYLVGGFDAGSEDERGKGHHTYGFLDMGGASAQIAFAPNTTEADKHADNLTLLRLRTSDGKSQEHRVFVTTYLGFGVNEARKDYLESLVTSYPLKTLEYPDPCLPAGVKMALDSKSIITSTTDESHLIGTGQFDSCLKSTLPLLRLKEPCDDDPCLFGQHVPLIDFDVNHFIGVSQYWHTTHEIFEMGFGEKAFDLGTYQKRVHEFCSLEWSDIQDAIESKTYKKVDQQGASEVCFKASWLISILHDGLGIETDIKKIEANPKNGTSDLIEGSKDKAFLNPFTAVDEIKKTEVSWTLGKMLLYASSAIPPPSPETLPYPASIEYLPVGFGSNDGSKIPADWTYPSVNATLRFSSTGSSITDVIPFIKSDVQHRIPGFIFFLLILIIGIFALRHRISARLFGTIPQGRFSHVYNKPPPPGLLSRIPIIGRLLGQHQYDRISNMEAGQPLAQPSDFELGDWDEEDDIKDEGRLGFSPLRKGTSRTASPRPSAMDRRGLVVRTGSTDRLDIGPNGIRSKSRTGSPNGTKLKSLD